MPSLSPRWRKVLGDLRGNKARTALVVLSIAIGVFAVGMIATTRLVLSEDLAASQAAANLAGATISMTTPFDTDLVRTVRRVEGVGEAEGLRTATVRVQIGPGEWRTLQLTARQDYRDLRVDKIDPERGAWPPPKHDVLIERSSLPSLRADAGDTVQIETPDGKRHEILVAGVVHDLSARPALFSGGTVYGYVTLETLDWLGLPHTFNELHLTAAEQPADKAHVTAVADRVKRRIEQAQYLVASVYVPDPGGDLLSQLIQPLLLILTALGGLSLFLSGFLVVNTITALLTQQVPQIGVMKAIGAKTGQVLRMYLVTVLIYGLLSLAVAAPLGIGAGYALTGYLATMMNFDLAGFRVPPLTLALDAAVALLVPLLAALWPVTSGVRITVREALSDQGPGSGGRGRFDRLVERVRGLPRPLLLSLRNTFRRKARLALTLATLTLGGAMFIAVLSVHASLLTTLDAALDYWQYDVQLEFGESYRTDRIVDEAMQVPGVVAAETWARSTANRVRPDGREGPTIFVLGPPAATTMIRPVVLDGRWLRDDDEDAIVLNTEVTRNEPSVKVGDELVLKIDAKETRWRLVGIVRGVITGPIAYASPAALARAAHSPGRANNAQIVLQQHDSAAQTAAVAALKDRLDGARLRVGTTDTTGNVRSGVVSQVNMIVVLMVVMALLMAVVGGLGLAGMMSINVLERTREIGVLRAIGASTGAILQIFVVEGMLVGALSWLAAAAISLPMSRLLSDAVGLALVHARLSFTFSLPGALLWLAVVLILAALASLLPALRAARITVRQVLAYE